jgi:hypothetical protein
VRYASVHGDISSLDPKGRAAMALARAISPSPVVLDDTVIESTRKRAEWITFCGS